MRFVFVAPRFHTNQYPLVRYLVKCGHTLDFYVVTKGFSEDYSYLQPKLIPSAKFYRFISKHLRNKVNVDRKYMVPKISFIWELTSVSKDSVIIIRNPHYSYAFMIMILAFLRHVPAIIYTQDPIHSCNISIRQRFYDLVLQRFSKGWFSPVLGDPLKPKISEHLQYIPMVIESKEYHREKELEYVRILMVGKFLPYKRHNILICAFSKLLLSGVRAKLTIVGEKTTNEHEHWYEEAKKTINSLGISSDINIITNVPYKSMDIYYRTNDLFVLPSVGETYGMASLEAMSFGIPVIVSNNNGFSYNISDGYNGYVFKSDDIDDLAKYMIEACKKENLNDMSRNCLKYIKEVHNPQLFIDKIKDMINRRI